MKSRVHRVTIDEEGVHVRETQSRVIATANALNFYGEQQDAFVRAHDDATEYLIGRVAASGGDKRRWRDKRSRARLKEECMRQAGVPAKYMPSVWNMLKAFFGVAAPFPWNVVIAAVVVAVERYIGST
jgi:hypothetical protein